MTDTYELEYLHHTPGGLKATDGDEEVWLPRSQVEVTVDLDACEPGDLIEVEIPEWLAEEKGLV